MKRAENFLGLEINIRKLLLVLLYEAHQNLKHWVLLGPLELVVLGQFAPAPLSVTLLASAMSIEEYAVQ